MRNLFKKLAKQPYKFFFFFLFLTFNTLSFQNCSQWQGQVELDTTNLNVSSLPKADCKAIQVKKVLTLWKDANNDGVEDEDGELGEILPYSGDKTAKDNYNYDDASAHPINGPAPLPFETHVFFYEGTDGLSFNFYFNIDEGGTASNDIVWKITTSGNNKNDSVIFSDEFRNGVPELKKIDPENETQQGQTVYKGDFHYGYNTDGGVIGPFVTDNFRIRVENLSTADNDTIKAGFYSSNDEVLDLMNQETQRVNSFIIAFKEQVICNDSNDTQE